jgi:hypothetical protein
MKEFLRLLGYFIPLALCLLVLTPPLFPDDSIMPTKNTKFSWEETFTADRQALWKVSDASATIHFPGPDFSTEQQPTFQIKFSEQHEERRYYLHRRLDASVRESIEAAVTFRLSNWKDIRQVAFGWRDSEKYWHDLIRHLKADGEWRTIRIRPDDIAFKLANGWASPSPPVRIKDMHFIISGTPGPGATLELNNLRVRELTDEEREPKLEIQGKTVSVKDFATWWPLLRGRRRNAIFGKFLDDIEFSQLNNAVERASQLRHEGLYVLTEVSPAPGATEWQTRARSSPDPSWRFRWHAFDICWVLLAAFKETNDPEFFYMARDHATHWLDANMDTFPDDPKYAWYDHGTALRTLRLLSLWDLGVERQIDVLFLSRLLKAIHAHASLLATESFFARDQPFLYHNHAVFQASALLLVSQVLPEFPESQSWLRLAERRILDQYKHLVTAEGASVENSTGYHKGLMRLCGVLSEVMQAYATLTSSQLAAICNKMHDFQEAIVYPDGLLPAFGDTWLNGERLLQEPGQKQQETLSSQLPMKTSPLRITDQFFPISGYAVLRHHPPGSPYTQARQLNFLCSSLTTTHKHADNLSFTLWGYGQEWLIDPGLYAYGLNDQHARYFQHARAHNDVVLNNETYDPRPGSARMTQWQGGDTLAYVVGEHTGYKERSIQRRIFYAKPDDVFFIEDEILSENETPCEAAQWFHAGPSVAVAQGEEHTLTLSTEGNPYELFVIPLEPNSPQLELYKGQLDPFPAGWFYTGYKQALSTTSWKYWQATQTS